MDHFSYEKIPFLGGWTSILTQQNFDVNYRGTIGFDTLLYICEGWCPKYREGQDRATSDETGCKS